MRFNYFVCQRDWDSAVAIAFQSYKFLENMCSDTYYHDKLVEPWGTGDEILARDIKPRNQDKQGTKRTRDTLSLVDMQMAQAHSSRPQPIPRSERGP